jgi:hypothetical protein
MNVSYVANYDRLYDKTVKCDHEENFSSVKHRGEKQKYDFTIIFKKNICAAPHAGGEAFMPKPAGHKTWSLTAFQLLMAGLNTKIFSLRKIFWRQFFVFAL